MLIALSTNLQVNFFEAYTQFLPPEILETECERQLKKQISDLQNQMAALQKERDLLEKIAMK